MLIRIGKEIVDFNIYECKLLGNPGMSGKVILFNDMALKLYHTKNNDLNSFKLNKLKSLEMKRIVIPSEIVYDLNDDILGYIMPYIKGKNGDSVVKLKTDFFLEELKIIFEDIKLLSENGIVVDDLHGDNIIVNNNGIYLIDSDGFMFRTKLNYERDFKDSNFNFNRLLKDDLLSTGLNYKKKMKLNYSFDDYKSFIKILENNLKKEESVKTFVKRLLLK